MPRLKISDKANDTLDHWLNQYMTGRLTIDELPLTVSAFLHVGYFEGARSREPEMQALERQINYLHYQLLPARDRSEQIEQRLAVRMQQAPAEWWDELETVLKNIVAGACNEQSNSIRAEQHSADSGVQNDSSSTERSTKRAA